MHDSPNFNRKNSFGKIFHILIKNEYLSANVKIGQKDGVLKHRISKKNRTIKTYSLSCIHRKC
jgi:hypothetical protein